MFVSLFALLILLSGCTTPGQTSNGSYTDSVNYMGKTVTVKKNQDIPFCGGFLIFVSTWNDGPTLKADLGWSAMQHGKMISGGYAVGDRIALDKCKYYVKEIKSDHVVLEEK